ncbi:hypothetical protein B879_03804 [Cecembia lonarensis LW9]|uniref:Uncharacterized protein n=2 Tax=Cecembia TaxID=1187078 RepID=K1KYM0_CECL9|nr:hypothetical protein B879_03804 [Cecembia lonarensis LW9]
MEIESRSWYWHKILMCIILIYISQPAANFLLAQHAYEVNSIEDFPDADLADDICADAYGNCTLRAAIENANKSSHRDTIIFKIPGKKTHTITLKSTLPYLLFPIVIDGTTQPGYTNALPSISLSGKNLLNNDVPAQNDYYQRRSFGLYFDNNSSGSTLRGLAFEAFYSPSIEVDSDNNIIEANLFGSYESQPERGNWVGLVIYGKNNRVGSKQTNQGNTFLNNINGLIIFGEKNLIVGNSFGIESVSFPAYANGKAMVFSFASKNNEIVDNLIISNYGGIEMSGINHKIYNNFIGTNRKGDKGLGNVIGVNLLNGVENIQVGNKYQGNIISGNEIGIQVFNNMPPFLPRNRFLDIIIRGNKIGTDVSGKFSLGNKIGILVKDAGGVVIGSNKEFESNLISGNWEAGIYCFNAFETIIEGNLIGTDKTQMYEMPNTIGIYISNTKVFETPDNIVVKNNTISGNLSNGIHFGSFTNNLNITGNKIGVKGFKFQALPNQKSGIFISSEIKNSCIGSLLESEKNIIAQHPSFGITYYGDESLAKDMLQKNQNYGNGQGSINRTEINEYPTGYFNPLRNLEKIYLTYMLNQYAFRITRTEDNLKYWYNELSKMEDYF